MAANCLPAIRWRAARTNIRYLVVEVDSITQCLSRFRRAFQPGAGDTVHGLLALLRRALLNRHPVISRRKREDGRRYRIFTLRRVSLAKRLEGMKRRRKS